MKNKELFQLYHALGDKDIMKLEGAKFSYGIVKNRKIILEELKTIEETNSPSEKYKEYEERRIGICKSHSNKNEDGTDKIIETKDPNGAVVGTSFDIPDMEKFNSEISELRKEYVEVLEEHKRKEKDYEILLDQEISIDFFPIPQESLPENVSPAIMEILFPLLQQ